MRTKTGRRFKLCARRMRRAWTLEQLEDRTLLALPAGTVPAEVGPGAGEQALLAPDLSKMVIAADPGGYAGYLFKFAVDGPEFSVPVTFYLDGPAGDAALALYD